MKRYRSYWTLLCNLRRAQKTHQRLFVFISVPTHGNLGDQAIVLAQERLLSDLGFGDSIFEIERDQYFVLKGLLGRIIRPQDVIVIDGGGNVGTLWPVENDKMVDIVERFPNNPIIIFPQTAYFDDGDTGRACQKSVADSFGAHKRLLFFARDIDTFNVMREIAPSMRICFVPDIVLSLDARDGGVASRTGALLCLRGDKERVVDGGSLQFLSDRLESGGLEVRTTSTLATEFEPVRRLDKEDLLRAKWDEFCSSRVVVTDRLHGMIFAAITGTPCVAMDNVSHKVLNGYAWLSDVPYIKIADRVEEVPRLVDSLLELSPSDCQPPMLSKQFDELKNEILELVGR